MHINFEQQRVVFETNGTNNTRVVPCPKQAVLHWIGAGHSTGRWFRCEPTSVPGISADVTACRDLRTRTTCKKYTKSTDCYILIKPDLLY